MPVRPHSCVRLQAGPWPAWPAPPAPSCRQVFIFTPCLRIFLPPSLVFHFQAMSRIVRATHFYLFSVYLRTTPETCYQRLKMRCREEEKVISLVRAPFNQLKMHWETTSLAAGTTLHETVVLLSPKKTGTEHFRG